MVNFNGDADKIPFYETFEFTRQNIAHLSVYSMIVWSINISSQVDERW